MALTSTLFTGLSGLDVNQTRLNVVGNNIANVNTVAFKASRAIAKPQFYVTDNAGSPSNAEFGGTNPSQRGLGASIAAIEKNFTTGSLETTGRTTDLAIDGDGFFVVKGAEQMYTRDGSFKLNDQNQLVTTGGAFVQGFGVDANGNVIAGTVDKITVPLGTQTSATATQNVTLEGNLNADGEAASGASILLSEQMVPVTGVTLPADPTTLALTDVAAPAASATPLFAVGDVLTLDGTKGGRNAGASTLTVTAGTTLGDLSDFFQQGMGIDPTVPDDGDAATPEAGVTVDSTGGFVTLAVTGNRGTDNALAIPAAAFMNSGGTSPFTFHDKAEAEGTPWSDPTGETVFTSFVAYDSLGTPLTVNVTMALENKADAGNTWRFFATSPDNTDVATLTGTGSVVGSGTLTFDSKGKLVNSDGTQVQIRRDATGAATPLNINLDFDSLTSLTASRSDLVMTKQDGSAIGSLSSFSIGDDGTISGSFSNGLNKTLGKVALATFKNPQGLIDHGANMYTSGTNSGVAILTSPLQLGAGAVRSGTLELSNVDLSTEFTNMIIASTGFSAASRVISTSNQLIQELLNTAR